MIKSDVTQYSSSLFTFTRVHVLDGCFFLEDGDALNVQSSGSRPSRGRNGELQTRCCFHHFFIISL